MTTKRYDKQDPTEFSKWLREQSEIDSKKGYLATNLDYIWWYKKNNYYMLIEEKRYNSGINSWQSNIFKHIAEQLSKVDNNFKGFHLLIFEKTNPDDGWIRLDHHKITKERLMKFLQFKEYK